MNIIKGLCFNVKNIRLYVLGLACFIGCLLYQTNENQMGTKLALASLAVLVIGALIRIKDISSINKTPNRTLVIAFGIISLLGTFLYSTTPQYFLRYIAFIAAFALVSKFNISSIENEFLKDVFSVAMTIYAGLTSYSFIFNPITTNYIHADVLLFGTQMDPNYVSIPFVAAANLCVSRLIRNKGLVLNTVMLSVNLLAILCAASRGAMVALGVSLIIHFSINTKRSKMQVLVFLIIAIVFYKLLLPVIIGNFGEQFSRMTEFGADDDNGRWELWGKAFSLLLDYPLLGCGLGGMVVHYGHASHNTFIQVLCETGVLGFFLFVFMIFGMLKKSYFYDKELFVLFLGYLMQIVFVDALADRLLWLLLMWISLTERKMLIK